MAKYKWVVQTRFRSEEYTQPWLTISHHVMRSGAEEALEWWNAHKGKYSEYRVANIEEVTP